MSMLSARFMIQSLPWLKMLRLLVRKNPSKTNLVHYCLIFHMRHLILKSLLFFCKHTAIKSNAPCVISHNKKVPQVISKEFNDVGIWYGSSFGCKCDDYCTLFQEKSGLIKRVITKRKKIQQKYFNILTNLTWMMTIVKC